MTDLRKAAEMALEALTLIDQDLEKHRATLPIGRQSELCKASLALRQALAQPEQEPVAWRSWNDHDGYGFWETKQEAEPWCSPDFFAEPIYTNPSKREWVGLSDEEIYDYADKFLYQHGSNYGIKSFGKAIEAKLKEKNT